MAVIQNLPEELLLHIITWLDGPPPSVRRAKEDPSVRLLHSNLRPLKNLSCVSHVWRRLSLRSLFKTMRLAVSDLLPAGYRGTADQKAMFLLKPTSVWLSDSKQFFKFIEANDMKRHVESLVIYASQDVTEFSASFLLDHAGGSTNYTSTLINSLWRQILDRIDPDRLVIFAPPRSLGSLLSVYVNTSDAWSFNIDCQIVEFCRDSNREEARHDPLENFLMDRAQSLVAMKRWNSIYYNEGSSLNAYGTYHYFEKRPPSVVLADPRLLDFYPPALTSFSYTAIFPHFAHFSHVLEELARVPMLRSVALQLAPVPGSGLLDDSDKIGKGNLSLRDCWAEIERCYFSVVDRLGSDDVSWTSFMSYDCAIYSINDDLNRIFEERAPDWRVGPKGTWSRHAPSETVTSPTLPGSLELRQDVP